MEASSQPKVLTREAWAGRVQCVDTRASTCSASLNRAYSSKGLVLCRVQVSPSQLRT